MLGPFHDRLGSHSPLDRDDFAAFSVLDVTERAIGAGQHLVRERMEHVECHVLLAGVAIGYKSVSGGGRQILSILLPGEMINLESLFFDKSDQNIQILRDARIASFPCAPLIRLMFDRPAVGSALFREALIKGAIARQWMAGKSMDAATGIAHLLCEMAVRLDRGDQSSREAYDLPVNQEQIAEIVGVTPVHVGRIMRLLEEESLVRRTRGRIEIVDWNALASRGDFTQDYLYVDGV